MKRAQGGFIHILLLALAVLGLSMWGVSELQQWAKEAESDIQQESTETLTEVRQAFINYAMVPPKALSTDEFFSTRYNVYTNLNQGPFRYFALPCPDQYGGLAADTLDGHPEVDVFYCGHGSNFTNTETAPLAARSNFGRLPWLDYHSGTNNNIFVRGLGGVDYRDGYNQRLWYMLSRNLALFNTIAMNPHALMRLNSEWLSVKDHRGDVISDRVAAVVISPGLYGDDNTGTRIDENILTENPGTILSISAGVTVLADAYLTNPGRFRDGVIELPPNDEEEISRDKFQYITIEDLAAAGSEGIAILEDSPVNIYDKIAGDGDILGATEFLEAHLSRHGYLPDPAGATAQNGGGRTRLSGLGGAYRLSEVINGATISFPEAHYGWNIKPRVQIEAEVGSSPSDDHYNYHVGLRLAELPPVYILDQSFTINMVTATATMLSSEEMAALPPYGIALAQQDTALNFMSDFTVRSASISMSNMPLHYPANGIGGINSPSLLSVVAQGGSNTPFSSATRLDQRVGVMNAGTIRVALADDAYAFLLWGSTDVHFSYPSPGGPSGGELAPYAAKVFLPAGTPLSIPTPDNGLRVRLPANLVLFGGSGFDNSGNLAVTRGANFAVEVLPSEDGSFGWATTRLPIDRSAGSALNPVVVGDMGFLPVVQDRNAIFNSCHIATGSCSFRLPRDRLSREERHTDSWGDDQGAIRVRLMGNRNAVSRLAVDTPFVVGNNPDMIIMPLPPPGRPYPGRLDGVRTGSGNTIAALPTPMRVLANQVLVAPAGSRVIYPSKGAAVFEMGRDFRVPVGAVLQIAPGAVITAALFRNSVLPDGTPLINDASKESTITTSAHPLVAYKTRITLPYGGHMPIGQSVWVGSDGRGAEGRARSMFEIEVRDSFTAGPALVPESSWPIRDRSGGYILRPYLGARLDPANIGEFTIGSALNTFYSKSAVPIRLLSRERGYRPNFGYTVHIDIVPYDRRNRIQLFNDPKFPSHIRLGTESFDGPLPLPSPLNSRRLNVGVGSAAHTGFDSSVKRREGGAAVQRVSFILDENTRFYVPANTPFSVRRSNVVSHATPTDGRRRSVNLISEIILPPRTKISTPRMDPPRGEIRDSNDDWEMQALITNEPLTLRTVEEVSWGLTINSPPYYDRITLLGAFRDEFYIVNRDDPRFPSGNVTIWAGDGNCRAELGQYSRPYCGQPLMIDFTDANNTLGITIIRNKRELDGMLPYRYIRSVQRTFRTETVKPTTDVVTLYIPRRITQFRKPDSWGRYELRYLSDVAITYPVIHDPGPYATLALSTHVQSRFAMFPVNDMLVYNGVNNAGSRVIPANSVVDLLDGKVSPPNNLQRYQSAGLGTRLRSRGAAQIFIGEDVELRTRIGINDGFRHPQHLYASSYREHVSGGGQQAVSGDNVVMSTLTSPVDMTYHAGTTYTSDPRGSAGFVADTFREEHRRDVYADQSFTLPSGAFIQIPPGQDIGFWNNVDANSLRNRWEGNDGAPLPSDAVAIIPENKDVLITSEILSTVWVVAATIERIDRLYGGWLGLGETHNVVWTERRAGNLETRRITVVSTVRGPAYLRVGGVSLHAPVGQDLSRIPIVFFNDESFIYNEWDRNVEGQDNYAYSPLSPGARMDMAGNVELRQERGLYADLLPPDARQLYTDFPMSYAVAPECRRNNHVVPGEDCASGIGEGLQFNVEEGEEYILESDYRLPSEAIIVPDVSEGERRMSLEVADLNNSVIVSMGGIQARAIKISQEGNVELAGVLVTVTGVSSTALDSNYFINRQLRVHVGGVGNRLGARVYMDTAVEDVLLDEDVASSPVLLTVSYARVEGTLTIFGGGYVGSSVKEAAGGVIIPAGQEVELGTGAGLARIAIGTEIFGSDSRAVVRVPAKTGVTQALLNLSSYVYTGDAAPGGVFVNITLLVNGLNASSRDTDIHGQNYYSYRVGEHIRQVGIFNLASLEKGQESREVIVAATATIPIESGYLWQGYVPVSNRLEVRQATARVSAYQRYVTVDYNVVQAEPSFKQVITSYVITTDGAAARTTVAQYGIVPVEFTLASPITRPTALAVSIVKFGDGYFNQSGSIYAADLAGYTAPTTLFRRAEAVTAALFPDNRMNVRIQSRAEGLNLWGNGLEEPAAIDADSHTMEQRNYLAPTQPRWFSYGAGRHTRSVLRDFAYADWASQLGAQVRYRVTVITSGRLSIQEFLRPPTYRPARFRNLYNSAPSDDVELPYLPFGRIDQRFTDTGGFGILMDGGVFKADPTNAESRFRTHLTIAVRVRNLLNGTSRVTTAIWSPRIDIAKRAIAGEITGSPGVLRHISVAITGTAQVTGYVRVNSGSSSPMRGSGNRVYYEEAKNTPAGATLTIFDTARGLSLGVYNEAFPVQQDLNRNMISDSSEGAVAYSWVDYFRDVAPHVDGESPEQGTVVAYLPQEWMGRFRGRSTVYIPDVDSPTDYLAEGFDEAGVISGFTCNGVSSEVNFSMPHTDISGTGVRFRAWPLVKRRQAHLNFSLGEEAAFSDGAPVVIGAPVAYGVSAAASDKYSEFAGNVTVAKRPVSRLSVATRFTEEIIVSERVEEDITFIGTTGVNPMPIEITSRTTTSVTTTVSFTSEEIVLNTASVARLNAHQQNFAPVAGNVAAVSPPRYWDEYSATDRRTVALDSDWFFYIDGAYHNSHAGAPYSPVPRQTLYFGDDFVIQGPAAIVPPFGGKTEEATRNVYSDRSLLMHALMPDLAVSGAGAGVPGGGLHPLYDSTLTARCKRGAPCEAMYRNPYWYPIVGGVMTFDGLQVSLPSSTTALGNEGVRLVMPQPQAVLPLELGGSVTVYAGSIIYPKRRRVLLSNPLPQGNYRIFSNGDIYAHVDVSPVRYEVNHEVRVPQPQQFDGGIFNFAPQQVTTSGGGIICVVEPLGMASEGPYFDFDPRSYTRYAPPSYTPPVTFVGFTVHKPVPVQPRRDGHNILYAYTDTVGPYRDVPNRMGYLNPLVVGEIPPYNLLGALGRGAEEKGWREASPLCQPMVEYVSVPGGIGYYVSAQYPRYSYNMGCHFDSGLNRAVNTQAEGNLESSSPLWHRFGVVGGTIGVQNDLGMHPQTQMALQATRRFTQDGYVEYADEGGRRFYRQRGTPFIPAGASAAQTRALREADRANYSNNPFEPLRVDGSFNRGALLSRSALDLFTGYHLGQRVVNLPNNPYEAVAIAAAYSPESGHTRFAGDNAVRLLRGQFNTLDNTDARFFGNPASFRWQFAGDHTFLMGVNNITINTDPKIKIFNVTNTLTTFMTMAQTMTQTVTQTALQTVTQTVVTTDATGTSVTLTNTVTNTVTSTVTSTLTSAVVTTLRSTTTMQVTQTISAFTDAEVRYNEVALQHRTTGDEMRSLRLHHRVRIPSSADIRISGFDVDTDPSYGGSYFQFPRGSEAIIVNNDTNSWLSAHPYLGLYRQGMVLSLNTPGAPQRVTIGAENDSYRRMDVSGMYVMHYQRSESSQYNEPLSAVPIHTNVWLRFPRGGRLVNTATGETFTLPENALVNPIFGTYIGMERQEVDTNSEGIPENKFPALARMVGDARIVRPALLIPKGTPVRLGARGGVVRNVKAAVLFSLTPLDLVECPRDALAEDGQGGATAISQIREGVTDNLYQAGATTAVPTFDIGHPCAWLDDPENTDGDRVFIYRRRTRYINEDLKVRVRSNDRTFLIGGRFTINIG